MAIVGFVSNFCARFDAVLVQYTCYASRLCVQLEWAEKLAKNEEDGKQGCVHEGRAATWTINHMRSLRQNVHGVQCVQSVRVSNLS